MNPSFLLAKTRSWARTPRSATRPLGPRRRSPASLDGMGVAGPYRLVPVGRARRLGPIADPREAVGAGRSDPDAACGIRTLHGDRRERPGNDGALTRLCRLARNVRLHPFQRISRGKGKRACEHLVQRDAQRVEIAEGIDRSVHPAGLFRRHIRQRAGDDFGRSRARCSQGLLCTLMAFCNSTSQQSLNTIRSSRISSGTQNKNSRLRYFRSRELRFKNQTICLLQRLGH